MKYIKLFAALSLAALLVCPAAAVEEPSTAAPQSGTVIVCYQDGTTGIKDSAFALYQVGERDMNDYVLSFRPISALSELDINWTAPDSDAITKLHNELMQKSFSPVSTGTTDADGVIVLSDISDGLYLLVQTNELSTYQTTSPSLLSMPDSTGSYTVSAFPKASKTPGKPETPPTSTSPRTGVSDEDSTALLAVMTASAAGIVLISFAKHKRKKKKENE